MRNHVTQVRLLMCKPNIEINRQNKEQRPAIWYTVFGQQNEDALLCERQILNRPDVYVNHVIRIPEHTALSYTLTSNRTLAHVLLTHERV
jgi:hypothetical protein